MLILGLVNIFTKIASIWLVAFCNDSSQTCKYHQELKQELSFRDEMEASKSNNSTLNMLTFVISIIYGNTQM